MNILILSWRGPGHPNSGGAEEVTLEHAKGWVRAGHSVTLFTSFFRNAKKEEQIEGVRIIRSGEQFLGVKFRAFLWYLFGKHPKFDLVVDEFHGIPFFTPIYVRARKLAFIHEVAREVWKHNFWRKPFNLIPMYFGEFFEPWIFKIFYRKYPFMTVSNSTRSDLERFGIPRRNIYVIENGVKLFLPRKPLSKEPRNTAFYLGAISEDKGAFDVIKVFGEIERKDDSWQYWIAGRGTKEYIKKLKELAKTEGIFPKLKIWGYVSDKKKFELLMRAHVLVNPSVHEGWGLVNIEANAVGTPVIGYNVHGLRDSVKHGKTGILVPFGDYRALAAEILSLLRDKNRYERMREKAIKWSKNFSWEKSTKESLELIESL